MDKNDHLVFCAFLSDNFPLVNDHPDVAGLLRDPYILENLGAAMACLLYTSPSPRDGLLSRMPSSA